MDFKESIEYRTASTETYNKFNFNNVYDYGRFGILTKCLPKILFKGNPVLVSFIQLIDVKLIMLFKTIDKLKHFKDITS